MLEPGQRVPFFFKKINPNNPGIDEFIQLKVFDEEISGVYIRELIAKRRNQGVNSGVDSYRGSVLSSSSNSSLQRLYSARDISSLVFLKTYDWSTPFMISDTRSFTLRIQ